MGACASSQSTAISSSNGQVHSSNAYPQQPKQLNQSVVLIPSQTNTHQPHQRPSEPSAPPIEDRAAPEGQNSPTQTSDTNMTQKQSPEAVLTMLKRYIELDNMVKPLENKNVIGTLTMKKENLTSIDTSLKQILTHHKAASDKAAKEKADVDKMNEPSVKGFFKDQMSFDAKLTKEQEEYLEAVNELEVVESQLNGLKSQQSTIEKDVEELTKQVKQINDYYDEQDDLLAKIFSGEYGSDLENKLEVEVDQLRDRKDRIATAKYKWCNSRVLLQHACNQLAFTVKRWLDIQQIQPNNVQGKYQMVTECRNNLIAASQNITSAQRYLQSIKFPYCESSEIETLNRACNNIYVDMQTHDRHQHAYQCYSVTHKRCAALIQWFNNVIENTIEKDMKMLQESYNKKSTELRNERLRLIREKMGDKVHDLGLTDEAQTDTGKQNEIEPELVAIMKPDVVETEDGQQKTSGLKAEDSRANVPTPLPLDELAPAPSSDELFGNIEQLKKQHEEELKEFEKAQQLNKARMEQGLEEKLRQRRNRRDRNQEA